MSQSDITALSKSVREGLRNQLMRDEGIEYELYLCTEGKQTIGVGRNIEDLGISHDEAMYLLDNDINRILKEMKRHSSFRMFADLSDNRKIVICNMVFNLGITRFLKFKRMIAALNLQKYDIAATEMLDSKWASQVGNRAQNLASLMREG